MPLNKSTYRHFFQYSYLFIIPTPPLRKFSVQCVTLSSIFACVATLCVLLITYSSSPSVAVIKPSGLLNNSLANAWLVLIISVILILSSPLIVIFFYIMTRSIHTVFSCFNPIHAAIYPWMN